MAKSTGGKGGVKTDVPVEGGSQEHQPLKAAVGGTGDGLALSPEDRIREIDEELEQLDVSAPHAAVAKKAAELEARHRAEDRQRELDRAELDQARAQARKDSDAISDAIAALRKERAEHSQMLIAMERESQVEAIAGAA